MTKTVSFGTKPRTGPGTNPDEWVAGAAAGERREEDEKAKVETSRFTIDIPSDLHVRIKSQCALRKVKMRDEIQALLEKHFPQQ